MEFELNLSINVHVLCCDLIPIQHSYLCSPLRLNFNLLYITHLEVCRYNFQSFEFYFVLVR